MRNPMPKTKPLLYFASGYQLLILLRYVPTMIRLQQSSNQRLHTNDQTSCTKRRNNMMKGGDENVQWFCFLGGIKNSGWFFVFLGGAVRPPYIEPSALPASYERSPRMRRANWMSFGMIVTRLAWIAQRLVSSKRPTR